MAKIVGITGPSGSGKSLLCKYLTEMGIPCIDADAVYHSMLVPPSRCIEAIANAFGNDLISEDGKIDRKLLSARVFSDPEQLRLLNKTVLPIVVDEINRMIASLISDGAQTVAVDAPTLIESGFYKSCDMIIAVLSPVETRIQRIMSRDGISEERAKMRVLSQKNDDFYSSVADITIFNGNEASDFEKTAKEIAVAISHI